MQDAAYVGTFLKAQDPDRFYASLLVPAARRAAIQALYAFAADVAAVRERVREPGPGEIRLQWWTDAIDGEGYGNVGQNPLAAALLAAIADFRLPTAPLHDLIEARRFDLYQDPMPDLPTFEGYAGATVSVLYQLAAMILNDGAEIETGDAAGHLGVAQALTGHLRAFGFNAAQGRIFLPWSVLAANGVREGEVLSGTVSEGLLAGLAQCADIALEHLEKAERAVTDLPRPLRPAMAPIALQRVYLAAWQLQSTDPFAPPRRLAEWRRLGRMLLWTLRN